jgi:hypothetical protein
MQVPLREGDLYIRCPKTPINLVVKRASDFYSVIEISDKDAQFEVERALPET